MDRPGDAKDDAKQIGKLGEPYSAPELRTLARFIASSPGWHRSNLTENITAFYKKVQYSLYVAQALNLTYITSIKVALSQHGQSATVPAGKVRLCLLFLLYRVKIMLSQRLTNSRIGSNVNGNGRSRERQRRQKIRKMTSFSKRESHWSLPSAHYRSATCVLVVTVQRARGLRIRHSSLCNLSPCNPSYRMYMITNSLRAGGETVAVYERGR